MSKPINPALLANLTDEELARTLEVSAQHSPVIAELIRRLNAHGDGDSDFSKLNDVVECPFCAAKQQIDIDWEKNTFTVDIVKPKR